MYWKPSGSGYDLACERFLPYKYRIVLCRYVGLVGYSYPIAFGMMAARVPMASRA